MIADNDLLSMQYARILAENAKEAQKKLALFPQEKLDHIVESIACEMEKHAAELASMSCEETGYGTAQSKEEKNLFVCRNVKEALRGMRCVGPLHEDRQGSIQDVGIALGVIAAVCPSTSPVSTALCKALMAVKSGNAIVFSLHPRALRTMSRTLDLVIAAATKAGLPEHCISYLSLPTRKGTAELMQHPAVSLILLTGVVDLLDIATASGKPLICCGTGNGPAFIERTADIRQAVADIILSKTFDYGIAPSAEQCVVVDAPVAEEVRRAFMDQGAYFMTEQEVRMLAERLFYHDGRHRPDMVGIDAPTLARRAGFEVPAGTKVLVAERRYVSDTDAYNRELLAPILPWYVEDDWRLACEKCIELLLFDREGHTLTIHSRDAEVIRQFILKKPVARVLVNTPAALGGMGMTTELFPSMMLGSGLSGRGLTTDNVSPMNLIYVRRVGYPVRKKVAQDGSAQMPDLDVLRDALGKAIRECLASGNKQH